VAAVLSAPVDRWRAVAARLGDRRGAEVTIRG
jgi:hypothetical protein